jgi:hypothetical protein
MVSRRKFLESAITAAGLCAVEGRTFADRLTKSSNLRSTHIDRERLISRHNPHLLKLDPLSPFSIGNGEFAFTADVTGLQTLSGEYENSMPLCTMAQWGWHTQPAAANLNSGGLRPVEYDTHGRKVGYHTSATGQEELFNWLRENPHRLHLGRVALCLIEGEKKELDASEITDTNQQLDLWRGVLTSRFLLLGKAVKVTTAVHPELDLLAVEIESELVKDGQLGVRIAFPYGSSSMQAADWNRAAHHQTRILSERFGLVRLRRTLDDDRYFVGIDWSGESKLTAESEHDYVLAHVGSATRSSRLAFVLHFSKSAPDGSLPTVAETFAASALHWRRFWTDGCAVELAESQDPRAAELERRVVLSQYLTAIQCAGSLPPQETGLTVNSWYGKFHLEMHWWHATHFALWSRLPLFEKSLSWYESILATARGLAQSQGYRGARWPKMVGPEGRDSPSPIGPLLIWQQPHPIFYAELCYQTHPNRQTLERYRQVVFESAEFMASYAFFDQKTARYVLGPPVIPAQENHPPRETWNPTFELAYWAFGLKTAQRWRERMRMKRRADWDQVIANLAKLPVRDGVYLAHENCPQTFTERNRDHPSMLAALGLLPGNGVDRETMRRTLHKVLAEWHWDDTWGWDYPLTAMTAARLGETKIAVDSLLMTTEKNRFLTNGHNWQRQNLPCYLPGNGGLLYAVAMMAGGWRNAPRRQAPGFPESWRVTWESANSSLANSI